MAEHTKKRDPRSPDGGFWSRSSTKGPHPLPAPPTTDQPSKVVDDSKLSASGQSTVEKLWALRAYRRAKGLCDKCAEKWGRDHRCATTVQMHEMEEVWELFNGEDSDADMSNGDTNSDMHLCLAISADAISGTEGPKTLQLLGTLQNIPIQILVDFGSTNSFISEHVFSQLSALSVQTVDV